MASTVPGRRSRVWTFILRFVVPPFAGALVGAFVLPALREPIFGFRGAGKGHPFTISMNDRFPKDRAFETLVGFLDPLDIPESNTFHLKCGSSRAWRIQTAACKELLAKHEPMLSKFDAWASGPGPYALIRPADLGDRVRVPFPAAHDPAAYDRMSERLAKTEILFTLYAFRGLRAHLENRPREALDHLEILFRLAAFLQQNPSSMEAHLVGLALQEHLAELITCHYGPRDLSDRALNFFPTPKALIGSLLAALGSEMHIQTNGVADALEERAKRHYSLLSKVVFHKKAYLAYLKDYLGFQQYLLENDAKLGKRFSRYRGSWMTESQVFGDRLYNSWGRSHAKQLIKEWADENTAQTSDMLQATRIAVAARLFHAKNGRWPTQESDLVPQLLDKWPISLLDRQPIRWAENRHGVRIMASDGVTPCKRPALCEYPFNPPVPL